MPLSLRLIVYPIFAAFCLLLFSIILFPFDSLKNRVAGEIEQGLGGRYSVSVGKVSPAFFSGITLKELVLLSKQNKSEAKLDRAKVKMSLLPLLWGSRQIQLVVKSGKGKMTGSVTLDKELTNLDLEFDKMDLALSRLLFPAGLPFAGQMDGTVTLELYPSDPLRNTGKVKLDIQNFRLEAGGQAGGFPIPEVSLAQAGKEPSRVEIDVVRGNWEVKSFRLAGGDIEFQADGKVYAARRFENYRFNLKGSFQPSAAAAVKLPFLTILENQKVEGKYPFSITGRMTKPSIRIGEFKVPI